MENNILFEKINTAYEELIQKLGSEAVKKDEPMKSHITFRVGGNADLYIKPETAEDIDFTVKCLKKNNIEFFIIGNGSNLIVQDKGIRGAVIQIYDNFSDVDVDGDVIYAKGGTLLSKVASIRYSRKHRWCCLYERRSLWWGNERYSCFCGHIR